MKFGVGGKIFPESQMNFGVGVVFFLRIEAKLEASGTEGFPSADEFWGWGFDGFFKEFKQNLKWN